MKIRNGFVSNSSSSSFVLSTDTVKDSTITVTTKKDIPVEKVITSFRELDEYILEEYSYYDKTLEEIKKGIGWLEEAEEELKNRRVLVVTPLLDTYSSEHESIVDNIDNHISIVSRGYH